MGRKYSFPTCISNLERKEKPAPIDTLNMKLNVACSSLFERGSGKKDWHIRKADARMMWHKGKQRRSGAYF